MSIDIEPYVVERRSQVNRYSMIAGIASLVFVTLGAPVLRGQPSPDREGYEDHVRDVVRRWTDAFNRHDSAAIALLFSDDATFVNVYGELSQGRSEIEQSRSELHEEHFQGSTMSTTIDQVRLLRLDIAVAIVKWTLEVPAVGSFSALSTVILENSSGEVWEIVAFHNTPIRPPEWRRSEE